MRQQDVTIIQLAQIVTDFLEPVIPYLVIGTKKADAEAGKIEGPDVWAAEKKLWGILCSGERPELKEAAGDMVIAASDPEVKQAFTEGILTALEQNPDLALEISSFIEDETIQNLIKEDSFRLKRQRSNDKNNILNEFNYMLEDFMAKKSAVREQKQPDSDADTNSSLPSPEDGINVRNLKSQYTHIQLTQGIQTEGTPSAIRMSKIAEMNVKGQSETQKFQARLALLYQLQEPGIEEFMVKALDFASKIEYGDLRSQALSLLVPYLQEPRRAEMIEKALCSASNIQDEDERSIVLYSLAPHLRGAGKERIIEDIFACAFHIQYSDAKFQILSSIAPHIFGSKSERIVEKALEVAYSILSEYLKVQALSLLVPYLDGQRKEETIEETLKLASNLKDKDMRSEALSFIIPYLDEIRKKEVMEKALEMAAGIKSESRRTRALSLLDSYL